MPKGYVIVTETIKDAAGMAAYAQAAGPSIAQYGGALLSTDDQPQLLEGDWHGNRTVVLEFESVEVARAWYDSPEYAEAKPLRHAAAEANMVIVSGFQMAGQ